MTPNPTPRRRSSGSAFILVLIALVVLSILGLAIASMTQTEMLIGGNERSAARSFYVGDTGLKLLWTRFMVLGARDAKTWVIPGSLSTSGSVTFRDQVGTTPLVPFLLAPCQLCEVQNETEYNKGAKRVVFIDNARGQRVGVRSGATTIVNEKRFLEYVDVQPNDNVTSIQDIGSLDPACGGRIGKGEGGTGQNGCG